jgi:hypothetical protein
MLGSLWNAFPRAVAVYAYTDPSAFGNVHFVLVKEDSPNSSTSQIISDYNCLSTQISDEFSPSKYLSPLTNSTCYHVNMLYERKSLSLQILEKCLERSHNVGRIRGDRHALD